MFIFAAAPIAARDEQVKDLIDLRDELALAGYRRKSIKIMLATELTFLHAKIVTAHPVRRGL